MRAPGAHARAIHGRKRRGSIERNSRVSVSRRVFLRRSGAATAGLSLGISHGLLAFQKPARHAMTTASRPADALRADTLAKFVDALPIPPKAQPSGVRDDPAPGYGLLPRRDERGATAACTAICRRRNSGASAGRFRGRRSRRAGVKAYGSSGSIGCRPSISCRSITRFMAPRPTSLRAARRFMSTALALRPEHDGYPEHWFDTGSSANSYYPNNQRRRDALVPRPHDGHQPAERLRRTDGHVCDPRRRRRGAQPATRSLTIFRFSSAIACCGRTASSTTRHPAIPRCRGWRTRAATPFS